MFPDATSGVENLCSIISRVALRYRLEAVKLSSKNELTDEDNKRIEQQCSSINMIVRKIHCIKDGSKLKFSFEIPQDNYFFKKNTLEETHQLFRIIEEYNKKLSQNFFDRINKDVISEALDYHAKIERKVFSEIFKTLSIN